MSQPEQNNLGSHLRGQSKPDVEEAPARSPDESEPFDDARNGERHLISDHGIKTPDLGQLNTDLATDVERYVPVALEALAPRKQTDSLSGKTLEEIGIPPAYHLLLARCLVQQGYGSIVASNIALFAPSEHAIIAQALIEHGGDAAICLLFRNLNRLSGVDHSQLLDNLLQLGPIPIEAAVAHNRNFDLRHKSLVHRLLQAGPAADVALARHLQCVDARFHAKVISCLIERIPHGPEALLLTCPLYPKGEFLELAFKRRGIYMQIALDHLEVFAPMSFEIGLRFARVGYGRNVLSKIDLFRDFKGQRFDSSHHMEAAPGTEDGAPLSPAQRAKICVEVARQDVGRGRFAEALTLLKEWKVDPLLLEKRLAIELGESLQDFTRWRVAPITNSALSEYSHPRLVSFYHRVVSHARALTAKHKSRSGDEGYPSIRKGTDLADILEEYHPSIADLLISRGRADYVVAHLDQFRGIDHSEVAFSMLYHKSKCLDVLLEHLGAFSELGPGVAEGLVEASYSIDAILRNQSSFESIRWDGVADCMLRLVGSGTPTERQELGSSFVMLLKNIDNLTGIDRRALIKSLVEKDSGFVLVILDNLSNPTAAEQEILVRALLCDSYSLCPSVENLRKLRRDLRQQVIDELLQAHPTFVFENVHLLAETYPEGPSRTGFYERLDDAIGRRLSSHCNRWSLLDRSFEPIPPDPSFENGILRILEHPEHYTWLNQSTREILLNFRSQAWAQRVDTPEELSAADSQAFLGRLIKLGMWDVISRNLHKFKGVDPTALLIAPDQFVPSAHRPSGRRMLDLTTTPHRLDVFSFAKDFVIPNLQLFRGSECQDAIERLIAKEPALFAAKGAPLTRLGGLDTERLQRLLMSLGWEGKKILVEHWHMFPAISATELLDFVIEHDQRLEQDPYVPPDELLEGPFSSEYQVSIAERLLRPDRPQPLLLLRMIKALPSIDRNWLAEQLIIVGRPELFIDHLDSFPELDLNSIGYRLLERSAQGVEAVLSNLEKFPGLEHARIVQVLLSHGPEEAAALLRHADSLDVSRHRVALHLLERGEDFVAVVAANIHHLPTAEQGMFVQHILARDSAVAAKLVEGYPRRLEEQEPQFWWGSRYRLGSCAHLGFDVRGTIEKLLETGDAAALAVLDSGVRILDDGELQKIILQGREAAEAVARFLGRREDSLHRFAKDLVRAGAGHLIMPALEKWYGIDKDELLELTWDTARIDAINGYFRRSKDLIRSHDIDTPSFAKHLAARLTEDLQLEELHMIIGAAGWFMCHKEFLPLLGAVGVEKRMEPFLALFPDSATRSVAATAQTHAETAGSDIEQLLRKGIPLLEGLGLLTMEKLPLLQEMIPRFLKEGASTTHAWTAHSTNLAQFRRPELAYIDSRSLLKTALDFHQEYGSLAAPSIFHLYTVRGTPQASGFWKNQGYHSLKEARNDIKQKIRALQNEIMTSEGAITVESDLQLDQVAALIEYSDRHELRKRIVLFNKAFRAGAIAPRDPRLSAYPIQISAFDHRKLRTFEFSSESKELYRQMREILAEVRFQDIQTVAHTAAASIIPFLNAKRTELRSKLEDMSTYQAPGDLPAALSQGYAEENESMRDAIEAELHRIKSFMGKLEGPASPGEILRTLCDYPTYEPEICDAIRRIALRRNLDTIHSARAYVDQLEEQPSKESVEWLREAVSRNLVEEALGDYVLLDHQKKVVARCFNLEPFDEDAKKIAKIETKEAVEVLVHPTRGILGELSGFNADVCWSRKPDLMVSYPNATALMFVRNAADPLKARIVGACMLLEVKDRSGDAVLVVRGLNPTRNFIKNLSAKSFVERFIDDAVVPMATSLGVNKIAIPGVGLFDAQTNRPAINEYLEEAYRNNPRIQIDPRGPNSAFNEIPILNDCVLLRYREGDSFVRPPAIRVDTHD